MKDRSNLKDRMTVAKYTTELNTPKSPIASGDVVYNFECLRSKVEELEKLLQELRDRINPILSPNSTDVVNPTIKEPQTFSPFGDQLYGLTNKLENNITECKSIISRIQL